MVLTKDKVFWSMNTDSHEDIIAEYKLNADGKHGPNILRVEILPPDDDMTKPPSKWVFGYDQDALPKWADAEHDEKRTRVALRDWKRCKVLAYGMHEISGNRTVYAYGSATVYAYDSSTVRAYDSATVRANDSATVYAYGSATVYAKSSATVYAYGSATVRANDIVRRYDSAGNMTIDGWVRASERGE